MEGAAQKEQEKNFRENVNTCPCCGALLTPLSSAAVGGPEEWVCPAGCVYKEENYPLSAYPSSNGA